MADGLAGCDCAQEVSADFNIFEITTMNPNWRRESDTDTIYPTKNVRFYAKEDNAQYTWLIGSEVIHTREFERYFGAELAGETIEVKLIVEKEPNTLCFPNDDGKDTITKTFYIFPDVNYKQNFYQQTPNQFVGTYRVKEVNQADSVDIIIDVDYVPNDPGITRINIYNYDGTGTAVWCYVGYLNYRWLSFYLNNYDNTDSYVHLRMDNSVNIRFKSTSFLPSFNYFGRKLN